MDDAFVQFVKTELVELNRDITTLSILVDAIVVDLERRSPYHQPSVHPLKEASIRREKLSSLRRSKSRYLRR